MEIVEQDRGKPSGTGAMPISAAPRENVASSRIQCENEQTDALCGSV